MKKVLILSALGVLALVELSCTNYQQQAGLIGAAAGAAAGAAFGDDHQDVVAGAVVGGALGAGGAAVHEESQRRDYARYGIQPDDETRRPAPVEESPGGASSGPDYPVAGRTVDPDVVVSPYPPNRKIGIRGLKSGQLAKDPQTGEVFVVP